MSKVDIGIAIIAVIGAVSGYRKGFLLSVFGLVGLVLGCFGGFLAMDSGMIILSRYVDFNTEVLRYVAFLIVFIIILVAVNLVGKSFKSAIDKTLLGSVDEVAGALFGVLRSLFFLSFLLWILEALHVIDRQWMSEGSHLYGFTVSLAPEVALWIGQWFPGLKDIFSEHI